LPYASPCLHHGLKQSLAFKFIGFQREHVAGHSAVRPKSPPNLLSPWPSRLARRMLSPGHAIVFLKLVGAVQRRPVRGGCQAGANAEAINRRAASLKRREFVLVEAAARKNGDAWKAALIENAPDGLGKRDQIAAVETD